MSYSNILLYFYDKISFIISINLYIYLKSYLSIYNLTDFDVVIINFIFSNYAKTNKLFLTS